MEKDKIETILCVDDAKFLRAALKEELTKAGYCDVIFAVDGKQGVAMYKEKKPEIVLMDINMPKLNGVEALKQIIAYDNQARVIMVSIEDDEDIIEDCKKFGALNYIIKPFSMDTLLRAIYVALHDEK